MDNIVNKLTTKFGIDASEYKQGVKDVQKVQDDLVKQTESNAQKSNNSEKALLNTQGKKISITANQLQALKALGGEEAKQHQEQTKRTRETIANTKNMQVGYARARNEALGLVALATGVSGIGSLFSKTIFGNAQTSRQSANLGISASSLKAFQLANVKAGGTAEGATAQLQESANTSAQYRSGQGLTNEAQMFLQYGGDVSALRDGNKYLLDRARIIERMYKVDPARAQMMANQMGISGDTFDLIKTGAGGVASAVNAQRGNAESSQNNEEAINKLRETLVGLRQASESQAASIVTDLAPAINNVADSAKTLMGGVAAFAKANAYWINKLFGGGDEKDADILDKILGFFGNGNANYRQNYDPNKTNLPPSLQSSPGFASKFTSGTTVDRQKYIYEQLLKNGYTPNQAAGTIGSLMQESGLDPSAMNAKSGAYGIGQWLGPRKKALFAKYGNNPSIADQTQFMIDELKTNEKRAGDAIKASSSVAEAAKAHSDLYERAGENEKNNAKRISYGQSALASVGTANAASAGIVASNSSTMPGGNVSNNTSSSDVKIGTIVVNTKATDAMGIAKELPEATKNAMSVTNANQGMS